jgi:DNA-3-methyladenine glycosylase I
MSRDVVIGYHGKPRCAWAGAGDTAFGRYHDEVWGTRTDDESAMFEALTLGVFEVGLSWSIVFGKRDAFRSAFRGFDVAEVAAMTERDVDRLVADASIIRNRGKIQATVDNARAMMSASPNLAALAKSYESTRKRAPRSVTDLPTSTPQAQAFAKQLKSLRRAHERVRVHAERRRGQRPRPRVLPRDRLPHRGPEPLNGRAAGWAPGPLVRVLVVGQGPGLR